MKYQFPVPTPEWLHQNLPLLELPRLEFEDYFRASGKAVCDPELMVKAWSRRGYSGPLHCLFTGLICSVGIWKLLGGVGGKPTHRNWGTELLALLTIISFRDQVGEWRETWSVDSGPKVTGFPLSSNSLSEARSVQNAKEEGSLTSNTLTIVLNKCKFYFPESLPLILFPEGLS